MRDILREKKEKEVIHWADVQTKMGVCGVFLGVSRPDEGQVVWVEGRGQGSSVRQLLY